MKPYKQYIHTPVEEKDEDLRRTLISSITQKLQRMSTLELRETYNYTVDVMDKKKKRR